MTFRLALCGIEHETNQYVSAPTTYELFYVRRGDELLETAGTRTYLGGMVDAGRELGAEMVGALWAIASPWGVIEASAYASLKGELLERLEAELPVDAVAVSLHGAGVVAGLDDLEGDLCSSIRELVGPDVKIVVTHDLHGNITQAEADVVDAMFGVHHYPHDDMYERGREAVELIPALLAGELNPVTVVERLPMLLPTTTTYHGVGAEVLARCLEVEKTPGVIDVTFMHGFPYTDNALVGSQVIVTTDGDTDLAWQLARGLAAEIWELRDRYVVSHPGAEEAVSLALALEGRPVVINETSDNPGGGAPADGTHLLRALLEAKAPEAVFCGLTDPAVVEQAHAAGVGATIEISLGGKTDDLHGKPIECTAYVHTLTDGLHVLEAAMGAGAVNPLGRTAGLVIDGVHVIVISKARQTFDRTPMILHGIDPMTKRIVALKSSNHFRSGFQDTAAAIVTADPPGLTTMRLEQLPRAHAPHPLFPIDPDATYPPRTATHP